METEFEHPMPSDGEDYKELLKSVDAETDKALEDMACWETMEHLKVCPKCQQEWQTVEDRNDGSAKDEMKLDEVE